MAYVLALASAALYGAADFLGCLTSRHASTVAIVTVSQFAGMLTLAVLLPVLPGSFPGRADLWWGAAAGLAGSAGVALLYRALAIGTMAILAPTTAVCAVAIPVVAGVALGERPSATAAAGIGIAVVAIVLVSRSDAGIRDAGRSERRLPPGMGLALGSGVAIGVFFLALSRTSAAGGLWPVLVARVVSVAGFGLLAVAARQSLAMPRRVLLLVVVGGILDMFANALYLIAVRGGPLTGVVTLASLYPASTVLLARIVLGERLNMTQVFGIAGALAAVVLIVRG